MAAPNPNPSATTDIYFECPSCGKSLVVEASAEGMIVPCPQCETNLIVPPPQGAAPEPAEPSPAAGAPIDIFQEAPPAAAGTALVDIHEKLKGLATRLREVQTQWTEVNNRVTTRLNEVNRDQLILTKLEQTHRKLLTEFDQITSALEKLGTEPGESGEKSSNPETGGSKGTGRTRVSFLS